MTDLFEACVFTLIIYSLFMALFLFMQSMLKHRKMEAVIIYDTHLHEIMFAGRLVCEGTCVIPFARNGDRELTCHALEVINIKWWMNIPIIGKWLSKRYHRLIILSNENTDISNVIRYEYPPTLMIFARFIGIIPKHEIDVEMVHEWIIDYSMRRNISMSDITINYQSVPPMTILTTISLMQEMRSAISRVQSLNDMDSIITRLGVDEDKH